MLRLRDKNCCWFLGVLTLLSGISIAVLSFLLFKQAVTILMQQQLQKHTVFAHVYREPFKNSNWMKSAIPLVVASVLGILIGALQSIISLFSLLMDNSKSFQTRKLSWLLWMAGGMCIFILSTIGFALAAMLKVHEKRDPYNSIDFWDNYRFSSEVVHNLEGHVFCSALALNSALILVCIAAAAATIFRQPEPHLLLAL